MKFIQLDSNTLDKIYMQKLDDVNIYLFKARNIIYTLGYGSGIVYCWLYSIPQKWKMCEETFFELLRKTKKFDVDVLLSLDIRKIERITRPLGFYRKIFRDFLNFILKTYEVFGDWEGFYNTICSKDVFKLFNILKEYGFNRISLKNLSAMKAYVAGEDNVIILDRHVGRVLKIKENIIRKANLNPKIYKDILREISNYIDHVSQNFYELTPIKLSLASWFYDTDTSASSLLRFDSLL